MHLCISLIFSLCNYVYVSETQTAWATEVCLSWPGTNYYLRYHCYNPTNYSLLIEVYADDQCSDLLNSFDINSSSTSNSLDDLNVTFQCGYDNCYIEYLDNCNNETESLLTYSPFNTCITVSSTSSFMFDCDHQSFNYYKYSNSNCNSTENSTMSSFVTSCQYYDTPERYWQYWKCQYPPTSQPTSSPTNAPVFPPTSAPTSYPTFQPTIDVPFYNKSFKDLLPYTTEWRNSSPSKLCSSQLWSIILAILLVSMRELI